MEKHYQDSNIFIEFGALSKSLLIFIAFFTIDGGSNCW